MARDFRPKDKKKAPRPPRAEAAAGAQAAAAGSSAPAAAARPAMARPSKAAPTDSGNSSDVDDDTLMREIAAMGGSKEDLELVGRGKTKGKGKGRADDDEADDPRLGDDVMSFMKQLNFSAVAPRAEAPKAKPAKESAAAEVPAAKEKKKKAEKSAPAAAAPAQAKATPAAAAAPPEKKEKAKPGKKEREAAKAAAAQTAGASSSSAAEQAAPAAAAGDWKAERERKMAAEREAKIAAIAQAAAAPPKAKAPKKAGAAKGEQRLLFAPAPHWSTTPLPPLPAAPAGEKKSKKGKEAAAAPAVPSDEQIAALHAQGKALLEADNRTYSELMSSGTSIAGGGLGTLSSSDAKFISSLLSGGGAGTGAGGGTLSDRIAALTLLVQSSPLHNMHSMESLLSMAGKKGREESGRATRALGDWLASPGGLGVRKLRYFRDQPALPAVAALQGGASSAEATAAVQGHLILFAFEDALKHFYFSFLQLLEAQTHDTLPFVRKQAVTQTYVLLRDKSEQEQNLLRLLVNKLGDSERAVASKASGHLLELLATHPAMKAVVVREVAQLVLRPPPKVAPTTKDAEQPAAAKYNTHARYYGVLTLNQTLLTARDDAVAANLVNLYFELFESVLQDFQKSTGGREETLADAEAAAAAAEEEGGAAAANGKKDKKGRWRDQKGKKGKGAKSSKAGANDENKAVVDADAKMMAAILTGVRRAFPFAKLDTEILDKHMDTLFRITHSGTFNISIQALQLIFQVAVASNQGPTSTTGNIADRFYTTLYSSLLDARLATTSKQAMYLNLLFKALKADDDERRSKACVKRLLQTTLNSEPPWICGTLFLLGELMKARPSLRVMLSEPEDEGEERFVDQAEDDDEAEPDAPAADAAAAATTRSEGGTALPTRYDARKRDPRWAGAELTCLWEVVPLLSHFHPSVALHASQLLLAQRISTTADLSLNTLAHFLDRFVYRNPKTTHASKGSSIMQPAAAAGGPGGAGLETSVVRTKGQGIADDEYVNSEKFWRKKAGDVPVDQLFFHQYFNMRSERSAAGARKSSKRKGAGSDDDEAASGSEADEAASGASGSDGDSISIEGEHDSSDAEALPSDDDSDASEGEKEIWAAMKRTMPRAEGDEDLLRDSGSDIASDDDDIEAYNYSDSDAPSGDGEGSDDEGEMSGSDDDDDDGLIQLDAGDEEGVFSDEDESDLLPFHGFDDAAAPAAAAPRGKKRAAAGDDEAEADDAEDTAGKSKAQLQRAERKKRKAAPMFASAEDYAHLIDNNDGEDMA